MEQNCLLSGGISVKESQVHSICTKNMPQVCLNELYSFDMKTKNKNQLNTGSIKTKIDR